MAAILENENKRNKEYIEALQQGDIDTVRKCLDEGANPTYIWPDDFGATRTRGGVNVDPIALQFPLAIIIDSIYNKNLSSLLSRSFILMSDKVFSETISKSRETLNRYLAIFKLLLERGSHITLPIEIILEKDPRYKKLKEEEREAETDVRDNISEAMKRSIENYARLFYSINDLYIHPAGDHVIFYRKKEQDENRDELQQKAQTITQLSQGAFFEILKILASNQFDPRFAGSLNVNVFTLLERSRNNEMGLQTLYGNRSKELQQVFFTRCQELENIYHNMAAEIQLRNAAKVTAFIHSMEKGFSDSFLSSIGALNPLDIVSQYSDLQMSDFGLVGPIDQKRALEIIEGRNIYEEVKELILANQAKAQLERKEGSDVMHYARLHQKMRKEQKQAEEEANRKKEAGPRNP